MRFLLIVLLFTLQGVLTPLVAPWPPPDLLLLAALLPLGRRPLWQAVGLAYLLGLAQDVAGGGVPGLHALALAAGVFVAGVVVPGGLGRAGPGWQLLALLAALAGKWAALLLLLTYAGQPAPLAETLRVGPLEALFTVAGCVLLQPLLNRVHRRRERSLYL